MFSGARTKTNDTKNSNQITSALNTKNLQILVTCKQIHIVVNLWVLNATSAYMLWEE